MQNVHSNTDIWQVTTIWNWICSNLQIASVRVHIDQWAVSSCTQTDYLSSEEDFRIYSKLKPLIMVSGMIEEVLYV